MEERFVKTIPMIQIVTDAWISKRCIKSHLPLDILVIMLGTNDAKRMYNTNVYSLEKGMNALLDKF